MPSHVSISTCAWIISWSTICLHFICCADIISLIESTNKLMVFSFEHTFVCGGVSSVLHSKSFSKMVTCSAKLLSLGNGYLFCDRNALESLTGPFQIPHCGTGRPPTRERACVGRRRMWAKCHRSQRNYVDFWGCPSSSGIFHACVSLFVIFHSTCWVWESCQRTRQKTNPMARLSMICSCYVRERERENRGSWKKEPFGILRR